MFNIGILQFKENEISEKYVKKMDEKYNLYFFKEDIICEKPLCELNAIIAFENDLKDITKLCEMILSVKEQHNCYIFIISTTAKETGSMVYLRLGVDFVFNSEGQEPEEIQLVIENALVRLKKESTHEKNEEAVDTPLSLIHNNFSVLVNGVKEVSLTKLEYKTLDFLAKKPNVAFSYEEIYEELYSDGSQQVDKSKHYRVSNIIFHLRKKIEGVASSPKYIKTVRSKGYMLDMQENS